MSLILTSAGYPPAIIKADPQRRIAYLDALETASVAGELRPFEAVVAEAVDEGLDQYLPNSCNGQMARSAHSHLRNAQRAHPADRDGLSLQFFLTARSNGAMIRPTGQTIRSNRLTGYGGIVMITVEHLYHDYAGKGTYAVADLSFQIETGEIFGFLGPSGAGKSTVQNIMTGLLGLQKGAVRYDDLPVTRLTPAFFNRVGVSFEQPNVYLRLTGLENLQYFAGLFAVPTLDPMELLGAVGLQDAAHKKAGEYSKGMRQRLTLARALINRPEILFLDEPTSGLDPSTAAAIRDLILAQQRRGATIFLTTHNMYLADSLCDRVAFIESGRIAAMDTPANLKLQYGNQAVTVAYNEGGKSATRTFDLQTGRADLAAFLQAVRPITIHSQEATLEDIFIRVTGRGLSQ